jgi:hypothetical protein
VPNSSTWQATGYPGAAGARALTAVGRDRTWNNTQNFGALPKDEKPVNGYQDCQFSTKQNGDYAYILTPLGSLPVYTYGPSFAADNAVWIGWIDNLLSRINWSDTLSRQLNEVIVKALVKMADAKVNLPVAYAEASKTSDLIFDTARRIDRAYRAFRKGDLRGIAQNLNITPRRLHKSWLEYKYGWMPLLMDVKGAAEFFAQQHVIRPPRFTVSASAMTQGSAHFSDPVVTWGGGPDHPRDMTLSTSVTTKVKIWCELSSPHLSEMQQLGMTNPALVAWELIPFSFVFDWFIQVGDWLTALTAQQGVTIRRSMFSTAELSAMTMVEPATHAADLAYDYVTTGFFGNGTRRRYIRSIPDLNPFSLYPPMTNSFGFAKLVTSLALIQGTYRGGMRNSRI